MSTLSLLSEGIIHIQTQHSSMVLHALPEQELMLCHYGVRVTTADLLAVAPQVKDNGEDYLGSAYSTMGGRSIVYPALRVTHADGDLNTELRYQSARVEPSTDPNVIKTIITLCDCKQQLEVDLVYTAFVSQDVIQNYSIIRNAQEGTVMLHHYFSSCLPVKANKYLLSYLYGAWGNEAQVTHSVLSHGIKSIESTKLVRTSQTDNASFMLSLNSEEFCENAGEVIAGALAWSGNYKLSFQVDDANTLHVLSGINPYASEYRLKSGASFTTPEVMYTYSHCGAGAASRQLHDWARRYGIWAGQQQVPTLLNSWEGAYFDFTTQTLTDMMDDAAAMGLEMFVLDDGWFGDKYPRNHDKAGLGDWVVNREKLPEGIAYLADYAHSKDLLFGIWMEPEMLNEVSVLAEEHPDWVIQTPGRDKPLMRNQWVLDLSNPSVQDYVYASVDGVLQLSPNIDYIKWDANRIVHNRGSHYQDAQQQSHIAVEYVQGLYRVLDRLRAKHPHVLMQACASGGGRVDYGALKYFNEVWTSDCTDPVLRTRIQYGTSLFYPMQVAGAHVSASPNEQTSRVSSLKFRFDVASAGRLGMELQPKKMSEEEKDFARKAILSYKGYRDVVMQGDLYRLGSPYNAHSYALMYVSKDKKKAVLFAYSLEWQYTATAPATKLQGLDPALQYRMMEQNVDKSEYWFNDKDLTGQYLQSVGLHLRLQFYHQSAVFVLEAL